MNRQLRRLRRRAIALALLASCSGGATAPVGGTLRLEFSSPNGDDGAVLFTITGGRVESIDGSDHSVFSARPHPSTLRVILTGTLSSGTIALIRIPDRDQASHYSVTLDEVASSDHLQRDLAGYTIRLAE